MTHIPDEAARCPAVLKFGSSVLGHRDDYRAAADEVYAHLRAGERVVVLVSALAGETDALLADARAVNDAPPPALVARLVRVGELKSAALMALALARIGVRASALDPQEIGLAADGAPLDAEPVGLDVAAVTEALADHDVLVVPGFIAAHAGGGVATLGRGGSDLSAVFFAARLGAPRVRLIKDVDGVYSADPAVDPAAVRFAHIGYDAAAAVSAGLVQPKAIAAAKAAGVEIEVAAIGQDGATVIGTGPVRAAASASARRLRVALLGCGTVGGGVLDRLESHPDLFEVAPILVRTPRGDPRFTCDIDAVIAADPDVIVEAIGGADAAEVLCPALARGVSVVTANKAAVARHWDALQVAARTGGAELAFSAAVGGGAPVLEAIGRIGGIVAIEGVMNGTANFLLERLGEGEDLEAALAEARALGFAEADPSADVDGHDAADKLAILARAAFGTAPDTIARQSLRSVTPDDVRAALARGEVLKQVGRCRRAPDGTVTASVRIEARPTGECLAATRAEENAFVLVAADSRRHIVHGKGAGRAPTAAAVFADLMDVRKALLADAEPVRRIA